MALSAHSKLYSRKICTSVRQKVLTRIQVINMFIVAKKVNTIEWGACYNSSIGCYTHPMIYYIEIRTNNLQLYETTQMKSSKRNVTWRHTEKVHYVICTKVVGKIELCYFKSDWSLSLARIGEGGAIDLIEDMKQASGLCAWLHDGAQCVKTHQLSN